MTEMPPLPRFLDRKKWTAQDHKRASKTWEKVSQRIRDEQEAIRAKEAARIAAKKAELAQDEVRRKERLIILQAREAKKSAKRQAQNIAINLAMDNGSVTVIQLRKALPPELRKYARWAIRNSFKQGKLKRKGKKVYHL